MKTETITFTAAQIAYVNGKLTVEQFKEVCRYNASKNREAASILDLLNR